MRSKADGLVTHRSRDLLSIYLVASVAWLFLFLLSREVVIVWIIAVGVYAAMLAGTAVVHAFLAEDLGGFSGLIATMNVLRHIVVTGFIALVCFGFFAYLNYADHYFFPRAMEFNPQ
jgi:hypothetical protein